MILSNHPTTEPGKGYVVEFAKRIESEEELKAEAEDLAKAEGIWTKQKPFLGGEWGAVGLLVNESKASAEMLIKNWPRLFQQNMSTSYDHSEFRIDSEPSVITHDGFLHLDPLVEMNDFDFLLATPTVPHPKEALTADLVAKRMIRKGYRLYFNENRANDITTFQDAGILECLKR
jgi:hypothetical protein